MTVPVVGSDLLASAPRTVVGPGQAATVAEEAYAAVPGAAGRIRVLLVVGAGFRGRPWSGRLVRKFRRVEMRIAPQGAMPTPDSIARLAGNAQAHQADVIVAVGGGSVLDSAKAASVFRTEPAVTSALVREYCAAGAPDTGLPVVTVPTTPGTGAEATPFATIWDPVRRRKLSLRGAGVRPVTAILDPELLVGLPMAQLMSSVLDTLAQGLEAAWSVHADSQAEALGEAAWTELSGLFDDPGRSPASIGRQAALLAGHYSGRAIAIAGTTICHALSYPLTLRYGMSHGHACGVTLAAALRYNAAVSDPDCTDSRGAGHVHRVIARMAATGGADDPCVLAQKLAGIAASPFLPEVADLSRDAAAIAADAVTYDRAGNNPRRADTASLARLLATTP